MKNEPVRQRMTETEYFAFADTEHEIVYEYAKGDVIPRVGLSVQHSIIKTNISAPLVTQLRNRDDFLALSHVRIKCTAPYVCYRYPDVMVVPTAISSVDYRDDTIDNPIVVIEIIAPETELTDRRDKLHEYIKTPSIQEYLLVNENKMYIEKFWRESNRWYYKSFDKDDGDVSLHSIGCTLNIEDMYYKTPLNPFNSDSTENDS